jgi:hypothetical protein
MYVSLPARPCARDIAGGRPFAFCHSASQASRSRPCSAPKRHRSTSQGVTGSPVMTLVSKFA